MIKMTHYFYTLSSWSLVAESALAEVRAHFGDELQYEWAVAITDYGGEGRLSREALDFYYARLRAATGEEMSLDWWHEGYDWLVPDRVVTAAQMLGATGVETRLAVANAGLREGLRITDANVSIPIACRVSGITSADMWKAFHDPLTWMKLRAQSRLFEVSGAKLRPAFIIENALGDCVVISGLWTVAPLKSAIQALLTDERSYEEFVQTRAPFPEKSNAVLQSS